MKPRIDLDWNAHHCGSPTWQDVRVLPKRKINQPNR